MMSLPLTTLSFLTLSLMFVGSEETESVSPLPAREIREAAQRILADPAFSRFSHFGDPPASTTPAGASSIPDTASENLATPPPSPAGDPATGEPRTWRDRMRERRERDASDETSVDPSADPQPDRGNRRSRRRRSEADREQNSSVDSVPADADAARAQAETGHQTGTGPSTRSTAEPAHGEDAQLGPPVRSDRSPPAREADQAAARPSTEPDRERPNRERPGRPSAPEPTNRPETRPRRAATPGAPSSRGLDGIERPVRYAPKPPAPPEKEWDLDFDWNWGWKNPFRGLGSILGAIVHFVAYGALIVMAVLILVLAVRAILELLRQRQATFSRTVNHGQLLDDDRAPGDLAADIYLQRALSLAGEQNYHDAVAQLLLGSMSTIERSRWIHYRRGLTLHDYLRAVRMHPDQYRGFARILQIYEPIEYGRRTATQEVFSSALDGYQQGFSGSAAVG